MRRYLKLLATSAKYAGILVVGTATVGLTYLQYINSQVGPIDIDKQRFIKYHTEESKLSESQAAQLYYGVLVDIGFMRLFTYHTYASYCEKLKRRIVGPCLKRYQEKDLLQLIEESKAKKNQKKEKEIFKQVSHVREFNMESLVENEYIIKELSKQQKLMDTRRIIGLDKETMDKVDTIHQFICDTGTRLKVGEVMEYVSHLADIERRLPGNVIHKIMFI